MTRRNWNDDGSSAGRRPRGIGEHHWLEFETRTWRPYRTRAPKEMTCCCCLKTVKIGTSVGLVFSVKAFAHWNPCFVQMMNNVPGSGPAALRDGTESAGDDEGDGAGEPG